ncbi:MAG: hypothetical protein RLO06_15105 [Parvibaculum sp.]|jgi:hypothetical protein
MTTYTVFNWETDDDENGEVVSGLSLEDAGRLLVERSGYGLRHERAHGVTTLWLALGAIAQTDGAPLYLKSDVSSSAAMAARARSVGG